MSFEHSKIKVKTQLPTRPFPPNVERKHIRTERLVIRPFAEDDIDEIYLLRIQPEVMNFSAIGRTDVDKEETRAYVARFLPPNDLKTYNNVICLASTGELIGVGGAFGDSTIGWPIFGWPEVGYLFKREYWGQGYATEFLRGWLSQWWSLPRSEIEVEVDVQSVKRSGEVPEMITALVEINNPSSKRVLEKLGFWEFTHWTEAETWEGLFKEVDLVGLVLSSVDFKS